MLEVTSICYISNRNPYEQHTHCLHLHGILYTLLIHIEFITFHQHTRTNDDVLHTRLHHDN